MPAKKKYFTEEERKAAQKECYKKYNKSKRGVERREKFLETSEYSPEKQREYSERYLASLTEEELAILREKSRLRMNESRDKDPARHMVNWARKRAKDKGLEFSITHEDILIPEICPVLGIPLFRVGGVKTANSPSLDRIDNSKGYIPGNVMVISYRANQLKNDASIEELLLIVKYMENSLGLVCN